MQSDVLISDAATAILSYCCLAATPQPIDGSSGRLGLALPRLPLESRRLSSSRPKMETEEGTGASAPISYNLIN